MYNIKHFTDATVYPQYITTCNNKQTSYLQKHIHQRLHLAKRHLSLASFSVVAVIVVAAQRLHCHGTASFLSHHWLRSCESHLYKEQDLALLSSPPRWHFAQEREAAQNGAAMTLVHQHFVLKQQEKAMVIM